MGLERNDGGLDVLVEILIEADLSRFEGFARRQVGGIDFGLAVADAHRAGHVAHADFVVAHLVPDVGGGFTPLGGDKADDIDARLGEGDESLDRFADMVVARELVDGLRRNQRGVLAEGRFVGVGVARREEAVVEQPPHLHFDAAQVRGVDLIFHAVGRRHGGLAGRTQGGRIHSVDQALDALLVGAHPFMLQQFLCFLADFQVVGARGGRLPFTVDFLLVVAQLPVEQHHHPRMVLVFDDVGVEAVAEHFPAQGVVVGGIGVRLFPVVLPQVVVQVFGHGELFQFVAGLDGFFFQLPQIAGGRLRLAFLLRGLDFRPEPGIIVLRIHGKDKSGHQGDRP